MDFNKHIFEDFFNGVDTKEIQSSNVYDEQYFDSDKMMRVVVHVMSMFSSFRFNIKKVMKKIQLLAVNSNMFENCAIDSVRILNLNHTGYEETYDYENIPDSERYTFEFARKADCNEVFVKVEVAMNFNVRCTDDYVSYKNFAFDFYDFYKKMRNVCYVHSDDDAWLQFLSKSGSYYSMKADFNLCDNIKPNMLSELYEKIFNKDVENPDDNLLTGVIGNFNVERLVGSAKKVLDVNDGYFYNCGMKIDSYDVVYTEDEVLKNGVIVYLNLHLYDDKDLNIVINAGKISKIIKILILDNIPYLYRRQKHIIVCVRADKKIDGLDRKTLDVIFDSRPDKMLVDSAKIMPCELKDSNGSLVKNTRMLKIEYKNGARCYVVFPKNNGYIFRPDIDKKYKFYSYRYEVVDKDVATIKYF